MKSIQSWAQSANKHDISLSYGSGFVFQKNIHPLLFIGGVHGDEPEGVELARCLENYLRENEKGLCPWLLIPCLNPDGYMKNKRTNGKGVDLNRNYPASNWSNQYEKDRYYPGPQKGSEPEIQALSELIEKERPRLIVHFHSWKPCIIYTGEPALKDAKRLAKSSGYQVLDDIGYPTPGSLSSYGWQDKKIPVICIEEEAGVSLKEVWPRFKEGLIEILKDESIR